MNESTSRPVSRTRRIISWVVLVLLLIVLLIVSMFFWVWKVQNEYESTAVPYLRQVVPEIATWDPDIAWSLFDDDVTKQLNRENYDKIVRSLSILGDLKSLGHPQFREAKSSATLNTGKRVLVAYQIQAEFEAGPATIHITLRDLDGTFSVYNYKIESMAFVDAANRQLDKAENSESNGN